MNSVPRVMEVWEDKNFEILMPLCYFDFKEDEDKKLPYIHTRVLDNNT